MNEEALAWRVHESGLSTYYKEVESFQRERARSSRRFGTVMAAIAAVLLIANLGSVWAIVSMLPLIKLVPVYLWVRADGSVDSSVVLSQLPVTRQQAVVDAALWDYVRLREGYSYDSARYNYDVVSLMSNNAVKSSYQRWFNFPDLASPQVTVGQKGQVDIEHIGTATISSGVAQIRYRRIVTITGSTPMATTWTATVEFQLLPTMPAVSLLTDPAGLLVTSYQAEEDGAQ
jgi:type IV secretion system protein VirB8